MKREISSTFSSDTCSICWDLPAEVELKPCNHRVICRKCLCLLDDRKCPICRVQIAEVYIKLVDNAYSKESFGSALNKTQEEDCNYPSAEDLKEAKDLKYPSSTASEKTLKKPHSAIFPTETYIFSLESIIKSRRVNEDLVKRQVYQVVLTGSEGLDLKSLYYELRKLFPPKHDLEILPNFLRLPDHLVEAHVHDGYTHGFGSKKDVTKIKFESLVDTWQSAERYLPNIQVGLFPVNLQHLSIWELLCTYRSKLEGIFDVVVLCCDALNQRSFEELLSLDELLRNRYAPGKGRIWVILNSLAMQNSGNSLSFENVETAFYLIPMNQRPVDLLFMQPKSLRNFWHRELMQRIVLHARSYRKLTRINSITDNDKHRTCCCM
ncbi:hypothetical protein GpartN1_g7198.t1 [Galdieria partita]|uniref:RING-type domain-containing protein n=1 Tax=Galdieria partita TaxID=83374 RepID=A0A9C7Q4K3_9RHOD|nr:hypothetical protein GpartN1_g7198.t1 [Galdieria partita]